MLPFLPELPTTSAAPLAPETALPAQAGTGGRGQGGGALDFAGLLDAAMPAAVAIPPEAGVPEAAVPTLPAFPGELPVSPLVSGLRGLTELPEANALPAPEALAEPLPTGTILPESGTALPLAEPVEAAAPPAPAELPNMDASDNELAPPVEDSETDDPLAVQRLALSVPGAALAPVPVASPPAPPVVLAAAASQRAALPSASQTAARAGPATRAPVPTLTPVTAEAPASDHEATDPATMLDALPDSAPASAATSAAPANPAPLAPATPTPAQPAVIEQRAEPRAPAANQESTIAQVGEIREALRSVRPEMTLRHAEFGIVSLRIEGATAAAPQDWRAVLASRDPGFVPAVQAALADRAIAASADTASTGSQTGSGGGSGSSSDRSYGFSQWSGQGSSQPYLEHSGKRDEGAQQHQRQQQHRAEEAAPAAAPEPALNDVRERGLFA
jgi:hypothetical protein